MFNYTNKLNNTNNMKLKIRVLPLGSPAADGSIVSRAVCEQYLQSEEYRHSIESRNTLGYLTHRGRQIQALPGTAGNPAVLKSVIGKDDASLCVADGMPTATHYVERFYIVDNPLGNGVDWLYCDAVVFNEGDFDERAAENIKRLKGLIRNGIKLGVSAVIVAYWGGNSGSNDICQKIKRISSCDFTNNASFGIFAQVTDILDDEGRASEKEFSEVGTDIKEGELYVKTFSTSGFEELRDMPKTSKINGQFTKLAVKQFSCASCVSEIAESEGASTKDSVVLEAKEFSATEEQKEFTVAGIRDRLRESKMSPRMYFRRTYLSYKQMLKTGNLSEEDTRILKSMFTSDILYILNKVQPEILQGKQINTLLGCSSLSAACRKAAQQLQLPFRMALNELNKQGYLSKVRYQKLQDAYIEFVHALIDDVFGPKVEDVIIAPASDAVRKLG